MSFERHLALKKLWTFRAYWHVLYLLALYLIKPEPRHSSPGLQARPRVCFTSKCLVPLTSSGKPRGYSGSVKNVDKVGLDKKLVEQLNKAKKITRNTGCPLESKLRSKCRAFFRIENARTGAFYFTQFALSGILKWASAQTLSHITRADTPSPPLAATHLSLTLLPPFLAKFSPPSLILFLHFPSEAYFSIFNVWL